MVRLSMRRMQSAVLCAWLLELGATVLGTSFAAHSFAAAITPSPSPSPNPPYPHSPVVESIAWHWETYTTATPGSDLWPVTWGPDDHLYTA